MDIETLLQKLEFEISMSDAYNERMDRIRRYIYLVISLVDSRIVSNDELLKNVERITNKYLYDYSRFFFLENYDRTNLYAQTIQGVEIFINKPKSKDFINTISYEIKDESGIFHKGHFKTIYEQGALLDVLFNSALYELFAIYDWLLIRMIESIVSYRANTYIPIVIYVDLNVAYETNSEDYKDDLKGVIINLF